jgi:hypothetical protein
MMTSLESTQRERVRVRDLTRACPLEERIALSGSALADAELAAPYRPNAIIPRADWRVPTAEELAALSWDGHAAAADDVLVIALPELVKAVRATLRHVPQELEALRFAVKSAEFQAALSSRVEELIPYCREPDGLRFHGAFASPMGKRTSTFLDSVESPRHLGMHVDTGDAAGASGLAREKCRRRLCVNAGESARYFLFVPVRVSSLAKCGGEEASLDADRFTTAFLSANRDHPIIRLRVDPGEAYVASTEDLIHDATTEPMTTVDISLHFIGHFGPPED